MAFFRLRWAPEELPGGRWFLLLLLLIFLVLILAVVLKSAVLAIVVVVVGLIGKALNRAWAVRAGIRRSREM